MPYNNQAIPPPTEKEWKGHNSLPLMRIKKIINADEDVGNCSHNAAFAITIATEMFIWHLTEQAYNMSKADGKSRRTIAYRDVANAVARLDNLEFLSDVVPKTMTFKQYKQKQAKGDIANPTNSLNGVGRGQKTLDQMNQDHDGDVEMQNGAHDDSIATNGSYQRQRTPERRRPSTAQSPNSARRFDAVRDAMED